jgi:nucleoside-diphosphate-sugar epimerase
VISLFVTALLSGRRPVIYGDGEQTRDFTFVANVVKGVLLACEATSAAGEMMNLASGGRVSLNHLVRVLNGIVGTNLAPVYKPTRRRRQGLSGGHLAREGPSRLPPGGVVRRRPVTDGRVVSSDANP